MEQTELNIPKIRVAPSIQGILVPKEYRDPWVQPGTLVEVDLFDLETGEKVITYRGEVTSKYVVRIKSAYIDLVQIGEWYRAVVRKV